MKYDLFVMGTGLAGQDVAMACADAGWNVGIADERAFGGTCPLRGCDPKKVLVHAAHVLDQARRLEGHGLTGDTHIGWEALMAFKRTFTEDVPEGVEDKLRDAGIDVFHEGARFAGPNAVTVGEGADAAEFEAEHILIATGAKPAELGIDGEEHLTFSDDFLALDALPERLVFVGGGYISMEFAHLVARAGAKDVIVLETGPRILQNFEADAVKAVAAATEELGIEVQTGYQVEAIERGDDGTLTVVAAREDDGETIRRTADAVVHGAGRVPQLDALNLEAAGVERVEEGGSLALDERHLRSTSNPAVYAAGDAAQQGKPLTPIAHIDARVVEKALLGDGEEPNYYATPTAVFTTPRLASVGLTEAEARENEIDVEIKSGDASGFYTARHVRQEHAYFKVLVEKESGRLVGAHLAYPDAPEVINVLAQAMRHGLTTDQLKGTVYAYPTAGSDVLYMLP